MIRDKLHFCIGGFCVLTIFAVFAGCQDPVGTPGAVGEKTGAKILGPYELDEAGFITNWLVVGPFPNPGERPDNKGFDVDYLAGYGGEAKHVPVIGMEMAKDDGTSVKWAQYYAPYYRIDFFAIDHLGLDYEEEDILAYAVCWLECANDMKAEIRVGSDDGYKLWLDHKLIASEHVYRSAYTDQERYPVKLSKGVHIILIKVDQDYGSFEFMMRVVTPDGKKAPGVKVWN